LLVPAAVLVPIVKIDNGYRLLYTVRSNQVSHFKNQVSFPGGKLDAVDDGIVGTALREANEEICLAADKVKIIGELPSFSTHGFTVHPVVGILSDLENLRAMPQEVSEIFTLPIDKIVSLTVNNTIAYKDYLIWGITARITFSFMQKYFCGELNESQVVV